MQKSINFVKGPLLSFDNDDETTLNNKNHNSTENNKKKNDIASLYRKVISTTSTAKKESDDVRNPLTFYINRQIQKEQKNKKKGKKEIKKKPSEVEQIKEKHSSESHESFYCEICKAIVNVPKIKHIHSIPHMLSNDIGNNGTQAEFHLKGDNVGYQLLVKQGWDEQSGLGSNEDGRLYPVRVNYKHDKTGIGIKMKPTETTPAASNYQLKDEKLLAETKADKLYNKLSNEDKYSTLLISSNPNSSYKGDSISKEEYAILSNMNYEFKNTLPNPSPTVSQLRKHQKMVETLELAKKKGLNIGSTPFPSFSSSHAKREKIFNKTISKQHTNKKKEYKNKIKKEEISRLRLLEYLKK